MTYKSFTLLLFSCSFCFAQLSIQNDYYIFVNDQVVFVNDDVNIDDTDSKFYLRNESQLVQGTGTTGNSGLGALSVYQNSEVNQYAYHYWCSPVGGILANTNTNNAFRVNQIDDPLLGTPDLIDSNDSAFTTAYEGTTSPSLTISSQWLWAFIAGDAYADWAYIGDANDLAPGLGFTMKGMGSGAGTDQFYDFRGKPNNGTITNTIAADQFTLIGNPYPSAIDAADFLWDTDNSNLDEVDAPPAGTTGALYYWEQDPANSNSHLLTSYVGGYASYTCTEPDGSDNIVESFVPATYIYYLTDGTPAATPPQGTGTRVAGRYIPVGQGFMVQGATGISAGSLVYLKNSHRAYVKESNADSFFFRYQQEAERSELADTKIYTDEGNFIVPEDYKRFRLIVSFNELYSRELLANFHSSATTNFDYGLEAKRPTELASDAYWVQNNDQLVIQAHNFTPELRIPLSLDIETAQPISFGVFDIQNFESSQGIFLYDADYGTYVDLRDQNYHINVEEGNYTDRFEIVFIPEALGVNDTNIRELDISQNNNIQTLNVLNPNIQNIASIEIYDTSGKQIIKKRYDTNKDRYNLSTGALSDGVYIVNVLSDNSEIIKTQKIIVSNK